MPGYQNHLTSMIGNYLRDEVIYIGSSISGKLINHICSQAELSRQRLNGLPRAAKLAVIYCCYSSIFADMYQSLSAW